MLSFGRRLFVSSALVVSFFAGAAGEAQGQPRSFAGQRLGRNQSGEEVKVVREIGSGYDDRLQAIAVARMGNVESVIVRGRDNRWHALATTANAYGGFSSAADNFEVREAVPLASPSGIAAMRKSGDKKFFAMVLGVEEKEIQTTYSSNNRLAGFVNVNSRLDDLGKHGPERSPYEEFKIGARTAIELKRALVERGDPRAAAVVLFHEATHRADYELAQRWATAYRNDTKRELVAGEGGALFVKWLFSRDPRVLPRDDAQTVADVAAGAHGSTEARAYVAAFIAAMQAGAYDAAREQLLTYAKGLGSRIPLPTGETVPAALRLDLEAGYRSLDATGKKQFDAAFAAAKSAAPHAWIATFDHGPGRR